MTCKEYQLALAAELDGETPGASSERREAHAARCPACADEARRLLTLRSTLHAWPDIEPPPGLAERALERCRVASRPPRRWGWRLVWRPVAAALAAGCAAAALWIAPISRTNSGPPMSPEAAYTLGALSRAGARVAQARDRTGQILERVGNLEELRRIEP